MEFRIVSAFRQRWVLVVICCLHALWLLMLSYVWLNQPISYADEALLTKYTTIARRLVLGLDDKPAKGRFVFVNVSWAKALTDKLDDSGFPVGNQPITDRILLARFFEKVNSQPVHRYLLVDINFDLATPQDSALGAAILRTPRLLASYHRHPDTGKPIRPIFPVASGLADYTDDFGSFYKFRLMYDSLKTIPLLLYEALYDKKMEQGTFLSYLDGRPVFNTFILDFRLRPYYLSPQAPAKERYEYYQLQDIILYEEADLKKALEGKIVVVGDFEDRDMHETMLGNMPGPLILLNTFLALEAGDMTISLWFVLYLFVVFFLMSLDVFTLHRIRRRSTKVKRSVGLRGESAKLVSDFFGYFFFLGMASVFSYFLFNIHLNVLLFALYLSALEFLVSYLSKRLRKAEQEG